MSLSSLYYNVAWFPIKAETAPQLSNGALKRKHSDWEDATDDGLEDQGAGAEVLLRLNGFIVFIVLIFPFVSVLATVVLF